MNSAGDPFAEYLRLEIDRLGPEESREAQSLLERYEKFLAEKNPEEQELVRGFMKWFYLDHEGAVAPPPKIRE